MWLCCPSHRGSSRRRRLRLRRGAWYCCQRRPRRRTGRARVGGRARKRRLLESRCPWSVLASGDFWPSGSLWIPLVWCVPHEKCHFSSRVTEQLSLNRAPGCFARSGDFCWAMVQEASVAPHVESFVPSTCFEAAAVLWAATLTMTCCLGRSNLQDSNKEPSTHHGRPMSQVAGRQAAHQLRLRLPGRNRGLLLARFTDPAM